LSEPQDCPDLAVGTALKEGKETKECEVPMDQLESLDNQDKRVYQELKAKVCRNLQVPLVK